MINASVTASAITATIELGLQAIIINYIFYLMEDDTHYYLMEDGVHKYIMG